MIMAFSSSNVRESNLCPTYKGNTRVKHNESLAIYFCIISALIMELESVLIK